VNEVELNLELLALLDLGAVGFQQRMSFGNLAVTDAPIVLVAALRLEPAIWARMARSSAMIS